MSSENKPITASPVPASEEDVISIPERLENRSDFPQAISTSLFSGPIPPPALMKEYAEIDPDFPRRFFAVADKQLAHDHAIEKDIIASNKEIVLNNQNLEKRGQLFGFILALVGLSGGITASLFGSPVFGSIIGVGGLALLAGVFVYSRKNGRPLQFLSPVPPSTSPPRERLDE